MAEQHGMQPEHHTPVPEKEFYDRARRRLEEALRNISELEERMAQRVGRSSAEPQSREQPATSS